MRVFLCFVVFIGLLGCKKESPVQRELRKALTNYLHTEGGDTIKFNRIEILGIDSVSEYRELLSKIESSTECQNKCIELIKEGKGNMNTVEALASCKAQLDAFKNKLAVQRDTHRISYYHVRYSFSATYLNETKIDTTELAFNKDFTKKSYLD